MVLQAPRALLYLLAVLHLVWLLQLYVVFAIVVRKVTVRGEFHAQIMTCSIQSAFTGGIMIGY